MGAIGFGTLAIIGVAFLVVAGGITAAVMLLLNPTRTASDRLRDMTGAEVKSERDPVAEAIAARMAQLAQPQDEDERNLLKLKLVQAGFRNQNATDYFNGIRVGLAILLPVVGSPILATQQLTFMALGVVILAGVGYMLPLIIVNSRLNARQQALLKPFPDALDLLVSAVEAGLGVDAAFRRVANEIEAAAPELAFEFQLVNHEISAGVARLDALHHLADRTGLSEVKSLVNMLTQAERFGTSIARALRIHSDITRQKRMSRAEEQAAKVSPKLTVIMILCLLPCLGIVLLGPAVLRALAAFGETNQ